MENSSLNEENDKGNLETTSLLMLQKANLKKVAKAREKKQEKKKAKALEEAKLVKAGE